MSAPEPTLHRVVLTLCSACIDGEGAQCHVPGCALIRNRPPEFSIRDSVDVESIDGAPFDYETLKRSTKAAADLTSFGTISLGGLIQLLEQRDPEQSVQFDFVGLMPTTLASYRGYYDHLALGHGCRGDGPPGSDTVAGLSQILRAAVGATYEGWKGGLYTMGLETPIWVDLPGECHGTAILGVAEYEYSAVILTGYAP